VASEKDNLTISTPKWSIAWCEVDVLTHKVMCKVLEKKGWLKSYLGA
jgi:hypothetical protein